MRMTLRARVSVTFVLLIALVALSAGVIGAVLLSRTTLDEAQRRVNFNLRVAWAVVNAEHDRANLLVEIVSTRVALAHGSLDWSALRSELEAKRIQAGLDFFTLTDAKGRVILRSLQPYNTGDDLSNDPFVRRALQGQGSSGFTTLPKERLAREGGDLIQRAFLAFEPTPKAKPRPQDSESSGMARISCTPVRGQGGMIIGALYGGNLLNRDYGLVDRIRSTVFKDELYKGRPMGTVTIFQWDVRIATNVLKANGNRAIGTRVSAEVYDQVLENNRSWYDRAFVVNDWYLSAYDPIADVDGKVIGILYVGMLERPYVDIRRELWRLYAGLSLVAALVVLAVGLVFARRLTGSLAQVAHAASEVAAGDLDHVVPMPPNADEVRDLTVAFNTMTTSLRDRDVRLRAANAELEDANTRLQRLNANYMDMLGFVSHELKNTMGVIFTSARSLDTTAVGSLTPPQASLVGAIRRSIENAITMTRNYLELSRMEKGELNVEPCRIDLIGEVIRPTLAEFEQATLQRRMSVECRLPEAALLDADPSLLHIVYKNLIDNALKYGREGGTIRLGLEQSNGMYRLEVWNEGDGLPPDKLARLFQKFVRFAGKSVSSRKGTGLGLFLTKEIIAKHGGDIWAESEEGRWMRFTFTLPIARPESPPA